MYCCDSLQDDGHVTSLRKGVSITKQAHENEISYAVAWSSTTNRIVPNKSQ